MNPMIDYLKFAAFLSVVFAGAYFISKRKESTRYFLFIAFFALIGVILFTSGLRKIILGDESLRPAGKFGVASRYQDVGAGLFMLVAASYGYFLSRKRMNPPNKALQHNDHGRHGSCSESYDPRQP